MKRWLLLLIVLNLAAMIVCDHRSAGAISPEVSAGRVSQRNPAFLQAPPVTPGVLDAAVAATLAQSDPSAQITVIVTLRQQASVNAAGSSARTVLDARRTLAAESQTSLQGWLAQRAQQGAVTQVTPFWIFNGFSLTATPAVIEELARQPEVLTITPDAVEIALAQGGPVEANLSAVNAPALWSLGWQGQGVVVASVDTGVDLAHPELAARWRGGANSWFDPYSQRAIPTDLNGHGTLTLGVMVGGGAGGSAIGLAPQARWIAGRIFNDRGEATATAIHQVFQWLLDPDGNPATDDAPHVVNNSWTLITAGCNLAFELDLQALRAAGILPIFAAGNAGPDAATSRSPANNPSAFAVGAVADNDMLYASSSRGPSACSGASSVYPRLTAPGVSIRTTARGGGYDDNATGTSLAAPHVAGGLALLLSAFPRLSVAQQEAALLNSAHDLGVSGADNDFGAGRLDLLAAYQWLVNSGIAPQTGAPIVVTGTGDVVAEDGVCTLREAILAANQDIAVGGCSAGGGGDTITFATALTRPLTITLTTAGANEDAALTGDLDITGTLTIDGMAAAAAATAVPNIVIDGGGLDRIFDILPGAHVTIQGLTIRNGSATAEMGGGVQNRGELTIRHAAIAANQGGGVRNTGGALTMTDVAIMENPGGFGVANANQGVLTLMDSVVRGNRGGVLNQAATGALNRVEVSSNSGNGIINTGVSASTLTVLASTILSNSVTGNGGGVRNDGVGATTTIENTRIAYNTATAGGGGVYHAGAEVRITASLIDHNQAKAGGGIDNGGSTLALVNTTLSANQASDNGGGLSNRGSATLRFVTLADNGAAGVGGNIFNDEGMLGVGATIISGATAGGNCANSAGFITSVGYNVENTNTCGLNAAGDLVNADPLLGALQDNGGATLTHALRLDSPAIDRVPLHTLNCGDLVKSDQRGFTRPLATGCDAGALESTTVLGGVTPIPTIQGAGHTSPKTGATVTTRGIVTVATRDGFYLEAATPDGSEATAEGIFVRTGVTPTVVSGDDVLVLGLVAEEKPTGRADELTVTRLINPTVTLISTGNPLPGPAVVGRGGRVPPAQVIDDDALASFDPATDGIDFYESLEGMRVQIDAALVVGATDADRLWVVADNGADAGPRTARGGVLTQVDDANPEVIQLDARLYPANAPWPKVAVGAFFPTPVVGIMDYVDAAYTVHATAPITADVTGQVLPEATTLTGDALFLTVGALNVNGLSYTDAAAAFTSLAAQIADNLGRPDLLVLEEVGDNNGDLDNGLVAADQTLTRLATAVQNAGGPLYQAAQIDPNDAEDGGMLGRNVRLSILYNPARLQFSARPGDASTDNSVLCSSGRAALALNPGRIGATASEFLDSRKPLAAQFSIGEETLFVIAIRLDDRTLDSPRFGAIQPPLLNSAARRLAQAQIVHDFVQQILTCEPGAKVIVAGAPNGDLFSPAVAALQGTHLTSLLELLSEDAAYSQVAAGISRVAGQMLVSAALWGSFPAFDVVHVQAEFADAPVSEDPTVARITLADITAAAYLPLVTR
ncbi:MAG TPA: S8 family serine peptidase [Chloroflexi bacterium]|nr:S8 family serine peptidase [Chloroflexota bacterium]